SPATCCAAASTPSSCSSFCKGGTPRAARRHYRMWTLNGSSARSPARNCGGAAVDENIIRLARLQDDGDLPPTPEEALALAHADRHAHELCYVAAWARWLFHDGTRWDFDTTLHAFDRARTICREVALECDRPATVTAAKTVAAVVQLARADRRLSATVE